MNMVLSAREKLVSEAKPKIKELEDKVENRALGKSRLKCEVGRLKAENDTMASLLSLRQNIDHPVPPSKRSPKKTKKYFLIL